MVNNLFFCCVAQLVAVAARPSLRSLEQLGAPQSWKLVCFSVKVPVELLGFLALLAYIGMAKDKDQNGAGSRPQDAARQDARTRLHI